MKKLLIVLSAAALTLLATATTADAGHYVRYVRGYDHCGHPVYSYRYVPTYSYRSNSYCQPSYSRGHSSHSYRHNSNSYSRPSYNYSRSRSYGRSYCR